MTAPQKKPTSTPQSADKSGINKKPDRTDESSEESFPASDAPTSWAGRDIAPQDREQK